ALVVSVTGPTDFISTTMVEGCVGAGLAVVVFRGGVGGSEQAVSRNARLRVTQSSAMLVLWAILFLPAIIFLAIMDYLSSLIRAIVSSSGKRWRLTKATKRK